MPEKPSSLARTLASIAIILFGARALFAGGCSLYFLGDSLLHYPHGVGDFASFILAGFIIAGLSVAVIRALRRNIVDRDGDDASGPGAWLADGAPYPARSWGLPSHSCPSSPSVAGAVARSAWPTHGSP